MNRRKFLKLLGLGAAVAPLLPLIPKTAAEETTINLATPDTVFLHPNGIIRFDENGYHELTTALYQEPPHDK